MRLNRFGAGVAAAALGLGGAVIALPAHAATSGTVTFDCKMPDFGAKADFTYKADLSVEALRASADAADVTVVMSTSDLPPVVPSFLSLKDQAVELTFGGTANGSAITLTTAGTTDVNPSGNGTAEPVKLPGNIQGKVTTADTEVSLNLTSFDFVVAGVGGNCTSTSGAVGPVPVEVKAAPTPEPTPTQTATPTPTTTATPTPSETPSTAPEGRKSVPAKGTVNFACVLSEPFNSEFAYKAEVEVSAFRASSTDKKVTVLADISDIPGVAPVAIPQVPGPDEEMRTFIRGSVGGKAIELTAKTGVNVGPKKPVPVSRSEGSVEVEGSELDVQIDSFRFEFNEMGGLTISAECKAEGSSGALGSLTVGEGEAPPSDGADDGGDGDNGGNGGNGGDTPTTALPVTGGGDAMPVIGLWALALGVAGAALLVWMPRQRRSVN